LVRRELLKVKNGLLTLIYPLCRAFRRNGYAYRLAVLLDKSGAAVSSDHCRPTLDPIPDEMRDHIKILNINHKELGSYLFLKKGKTGKILDY